MAAEPVTYFIQAAWGGPIKIGVASNVARRRRQLQQGNPEPLVVLATVGGGREAERLCHRNLSYARIGRSEWFWPEPVIELLELMAGGSCS